MKFREGEIVFVKLSSLDCSAIIKKVTKSGEYTVQFDGGAQKTVQERQIKLVNDEKLIEEIKMSLKEDTKSPSRRSPGRRSPARNTSPIHQVQSPARPAQNQSPTRKNPNRKQRPRILKISLDNIDQVINVSSTTTSRTDSPVDPSPVPGLPRRRKPIDQSLSATKIYSTRSETRLVSSKNYEFNNVKSESIDVVDTKFENDREETPQIIHLQHSERENILNDLGKFSDDDDLLDLPLILKSKSKSKTPDRRSESRSVSSVILSSPREFGSWFGSLFFIISIPLSAILLHVFCNKNICTYTKLPNFNEYKTLKTFVDLKSFSIYSAFVLFIMMISRLPFGGKKLLNQPSKDMKFLYCMNGLFTSFLILATIVGLESQKIEIVDHICEKYFQLLVAAVLFGFTMSAFLFVWSQFAPISSLNANALTHNFLYDFFMGRQVNPKILSTDVKMVLIRCSLIGTLIINSVFLYKSLNVTITDEKSFSFDAITLDPVLLVSCALQIIYVLDNLAFEYTMTTSLKLQWEGCGYLIVMCNILNPFFLTAITKYLYEHGVKTHAWILTINAVVFVIGYVLYRGSNSQKHSFRVNPYDPALSHLETFPTALGKKLIVSGFWGRVRHPNYLGDILMHLAFAGVCLVYPAGFGVLPAIVLLIHRSSRDSNKCKRCYGVAWDRYCHKIRYQLVPKVY